MVHFMITVTRPENLIEYTLTVYKHVVTNDFLQSLSKLFNMTKSVNPSIPNRHLDLPIEHVRQVADAFWDLHSAYQTKF